MSTKVVGFHVEEIGIGIPNPRAVVRMPVPENLTPEQLERLERAIEEWNAKLEEEENARPDDTAT
jgi:hypothetical protein